jgi:hypothetical protein
MYCVQSITRYESQERNPRVSTKPSIGASRNAQIFFRPQIKRRRAFLMQIFQFFRHVTPDALFARAVIDVGDDAGFAETFRKTRDIISARAVFGVVRARMIEMKLVDILEFHVFKFGQIFVRNLIIRNFKGRFDGCHSGFGQHARFLLLIGMRFKNRKLSANK